MMKKHFSEIAKFDDLRFLNTLFFEDYKSHLTSLYNFKKGQILPLHKHTENDEIFFVIKGKGMFTVGEETFEVKEGDFTQAKMDTPHRFEAKEETILFSVKGPKPINTVIIEK